MNSNEADTREKLIDLALRSRGWTQDPIKHEETAGRITILKAQKWETENQAIADVEFLIQPVEALLKFRLITLLAKG